MPGLSELEGVVVGIIRIKEPCTAYAVRRELTDSPSTHWSGSAGSVYPLLERLQRAGLITATEDKADGRGRRLLKVSPLGRRALRTWTLSAGKPEVAASVFDAVRARAFALKKLPPRDRERFAVEALDALSDFLATAKAHLEGREGIEYFAALGGVYEAQARVDWMTEFLAAIRAGQ